MGSLSIGHWLVVLLIVVLVFGTKRLKNVGKDLGEAVKGFKQVLHDDDHPDAAKPAARLDDGSRRDGPSARTADEAHDDERTPR